MLIYIVFTTAGFFELAIESWPQWDLNPQPPLNSAEALQFYPYSNFIICSVSDFILAIAFITSSKAEQPLQSMELQEKEAQKDSRLKAI